jgi:glycerate kinase
MKKIIFAPDSFKGTMTAPEVCEILAEVCREIFPAAERIALPVADGGEGSVDACLAALGGEKIPISCSGPDFSPVAGYYGLLPDGTAVVEMAAAAGLTLTASPNPETTTTFGVGQLVRHALDRGANKILLCLGGSATNDGGCGMAAACGVRFLDEHHDPFVPVGGTLKNIARIDPTGLDGRLREIPLVTLVDVDNPLCGPAGAAAVFGPQKGADAAMVRRLDDGLFHLADLVRRDLGAELLDLPGGGAAGGMGAGMAAFFGSSLQSGIDAVLDLLRFDRHLRGADLVLTGEGRVDGQTSRGKTVAGVARRAAAAGAAVVVLAGDIGPGAETVYDLGVTAVFSANRHALPFSQARLRCREDLRAAAADILRLCRRLEI